MKRWIGQMSASPQVAKGSSTGVSAVMPGNPCAMARSLAAQRERRWIHEVVAWGGEPHVQPYMKLNTLVRTPYPRFDWTVQKLRHMARWANRYLYKTVPFEGYDASAKTATMRDRYDGRQGLFV